MKTKSISHLVNLNNSVFESNRNFLAAFRLSKLSIENEIFKCNKYISKVLKISVRTLQRILEKLEKIGFLTRFKKFKNNKQIQNLIKLNITFFNNFNNKKREVSKKIEEKREFEQNLKNSMFSKNIKIKIKQQIFEIVKIKNFLLLKIDKKIVKKQRSLIFYKFLFENFQKHCNNILLSFENCEVEIDTENQKIYVQNLKGA